MSSTSPRIVRRALRRVLSVPLTPDPVERRLSGKLGGILWFGGGVVTLGPRLLGGEVRPQMPFGVTVGLGVGAMLWGLISIVVIDWVNGPAWLTHLTAAAGLLTLAVVVYPTGGVESLDWPYFTWLALYGCFFFHRRAAIGFMGFCLILQLVPLGFRPVDDLHHGELWRVALTLFGYASVGVALIEGKAMLVKLRRQAEHEAGTDALTGLASHRRMDRALQGLAASAAETGARFALAVLDIDHLRRLVDLWGGEAGEAVLGEVARAMRRSAGAGDLLARTGGDEFTWLMRDVSAEQARERVDAARHRLAETDRRFPLGFSAGVCGSEYEIDPPALVRLAEGALYWAKQHGRDQTQVYDPRVVEVLSAEERAEAAERTQTLLGLRALARAIDAKDAATAEHSERVGVLAEALALTAGWAPLPARALRDAARVHDVGKIGISDAVLRKAGALTPEERVHVNSHAEISARIVEGVLSAEQVDWIRTHHERADGGGYPRGLAAAQIPEGGALLAIADAFDAMTAGRPYRASRTEVEALAVCRAAAGSHFSFEAVATLERWLAGRPRRAAPSVGAGVAPAGARTIL